MADPFEKLFRDYALAFDSFDAARVAAFFHCPLLLVGKDGAISLTTESAIQGYTKGLLSYHREQGYARASVRDVEVQTQGPNLAITRVRWQVYRADDSLLWEWSNSYNLIDDDGWKILVATTHEDAAA